MGRATELRRLAEFLDRRRLADNPNELHKAAAMILSSATESMYSYRFDSVFFNIDEPRHPIPRGVKGVRAELRVLVEGVLDDGADDQFTNLNVNIVLSGNTTAGKAMFSWHLDRDDGQSKSNELHPRYHFQHAGREMRAQEEDWGLSLLLDSPRLMHPPLDGLLAVDFVLGAYLAKRYQSECLRDPTYVNMISKAQRRSWTGFAKAIASFVDADADWHNRCFPYWPQTLPRSGG